MYLLLWHPNKLSINCSQFRSNYHDLQFISEATLGGWRCILYIYIYINVLTLHKRLLQLIFRQRKTRAEDQQTTLCPV